MERDIVHGDIRYILGADLPSNLLLASRHNVWHIVYHIMNRQSSSAKFLLTFLPSRGYNVGSNVLHILFHFIVRISNFSLFSFPTLLLLFTSNLNFARLSTRANHFLLLGWGCLSHNLSHHIRLFPFPIPQPSSNTTTSYFTNS
ncbi:hypothetical protein QL285_020329 [Trifolium repens]|nr:hypothetical protein QL285_020329 [Trifolium repens]